MSKEKKTLILVFSTVGAAAIGGIILLIVSGKGTSGIGLEIAKALTQFLLVGVLGVLISLLVQNFNRQRDKEVLVNELRKTVLTDLITAYSDTKKARRILMGNRLSDERLTYAIYDEQIKNIIATQLAFELITHQITTHKDYFGVNSEAIIRNVTAMEKYLGAIIDEYKDSLKGEARIPATLAIASLPKLSSSMGKEQEANNFLKEFVEPYRSTVAEIRKQVLT
jgi:hypothetical protein